MGSKIYARQMNVMKQKDNDGVLFGEKMTKIKVNREARGRAGSKTT